MNEVGFLLPPQTTCTVCYINLTHIVKAFETSKPNNSMRPAMFIVYRTPFSSPASSASFSSPFRQEEGHHTRACTAYRLTFLQHFAFWRSALWSRWRLTSGRTVLFVYNRPSSSSAPPSSPQARSECKPTESFL